MQNNIQFIKLQTRAEIEFGDIMQIYVGRAKRKRVFRHIQTTEVQISLASAQSDQDLRCSPTESLDTIECINGERRWHLHMHGINYEPVHIAHAWWHIFAWRGPVINMIFCSRAHCAPACDVPIVLIQPAIETSGLFHHYVSEYMRFTWRFTGELEGSNAGPDPGLFNRGFKMSEGLSVVQDYLIGVSKCLRGWSWSILSNYHTYFLT